MPRYATAWSNDRKGPFTQRCSDINYGMDRTDESDESEGEGKEKLYCRQRVRRKRKTIVKIGRLLNLKRFICKTQFNCNRYVV